MRELCENHVSPFTGGIDVETNPDNEIDQWLDMKQLLYDAFHDIDKIVFWTILLCVYLRQLGVASGFKVT